MIVIADSSPIIALARINRLNLLKEIFGQVIIPNFVYQELVLADSEKIGVDEIRKAEWLHIENVNSIPQYVSSSLDQGEREAIALALQKRADLILIDEKLGRREAEELNIKWAGTIDILIHALELKLIPNLEKELNNLRNVGFWINDELIKQAIIKSKK